MSYENDVIVRQQLYLEAVKNSEGDYGEEIALAIVSLIITLMTKYGYDKLSDLKRSEYMAFLKVINAQLRDLTGKQYSAATARILELMRADYAVTKASYGAMFPKAGKPPAVKAATLWAEVRNDPVPGNGDKPLELLKVFFTTAIASATQLVKQAYSDKWTFAELRAKLRGLKANNFKDGMTIKLWRQYSAAIETIIQHVSSYIGAKLGSFFSNRYIWLSVLDANTTDICRGRNGNIYVYGEGPQPPAHFRCRSRTRPVFQEASVPATFYSWFINQPPIFQDDVFGPSVAARIRSGEIKSAEMPKYENNMRLTPAQYRAKQEFITLR